MSTDQSGGNKEIHKMAIHANTDQQAIEIKEFSQMPKNGSGSVCKICLPIP